MLRYKVDPRTGFSVHLGWCSEVWAYGWFDALTDYGLGVLVVGPVQIRVTWPLAEWPLDADPA